MVLVFYGMMFPACSPIADKNKQEEAPIKTVQKINPRSLLYTLQVTHSFCEFLLT